MDLFTVTLARAGSHVPWGFRLQGGADFSIPLSIQQVVIGSLAEQQGLLANDTIVEINGRPVNSLAHDSAKEMILQSGDHVELALQRGEMKIWQPKVSQISDLKPNVIHHVSEDPYTNIIQKTSLAADKQVSQEIGSGYNRTAKPFASFGESSSSNSHPFNKANENMNTGFANPYSGDSDGSAPAIRSVRAPIFDPDHHQEIQKTHQMVCKICGRLIIGVFVKIKGEPLHPECFKCYTCGKNLKNQGHFYVKDKMYCEVHARDASNN